MNLSEFALTGPQSGAAAPAILLVLHSSFDDSAPWEALAARLGAGGAVIRLNLQGCECHSQAAGKGGQLISLESEAASVAGVLDASIGCEVPVHVVGHGYAGAVALQLALRQRRRVRSLALIEPLAFSLLDRGTGLLTSVANLTRRMTETIAQGAPEEAARQLVDFWNGSGAATVLPVPWLASFARHIGRIAVGYQTLLRSPLGTGDLRGFSPPVCLVGSLQSPRLVLEILGRISDSIPTSRVHFVQGGHTAAASHPEDMAQALARFIAASAEAGAGERLAA